MWRVCCRHLFTRVKYQKVVFPLQRIDKQRKFSSTSSNNFQIEQDYFYINPFRRLTCIGCGEFLQTKNEKQSGFVPFDIYEKYTNGRLKFYTKVKGEEVSSIPDGVNVDVSNFSSYRMKTKVILCKRCYRLQHYKCSDTKCEVDLHRIENIIRCRTQLQEEVRRREKRGEIRGDIRGEIRGEICGKDNASPFSGELRDKDSASTNSCHPVGDCTEGESAETGRNPRDRGDKVHVRKGCVRGIPFIERKRHKVKSGSCKGGKEIKQDEREYVQGKEGSMLCSGKIESKNEKKNGSSDDVEVGRNNHIIQEGVSVEGITEGSEEGSGDVREKRSIDGNEDRIMGKDTPSEERKDTPSEERKDTPLEERKDTPSEERKDTPSEERKETQSREEKEDEYYYKGESYPIDRRSVNVNEKKDILRRRNDGKKMDVEKMEVSTARYVEGDRNNIMNSLVKKMKRKSLVLHLIDITNIENTILPELYIGCKNKDINIIWLVNKVDCLPKSTNLEIVKIWFRNMVRQIKNSHINDLIFISALKYFNYNMLEERLKHYVDLEKGIDIYIVGCVNVGKSSFVNSFLKYINYRHIGDIYSKRKKGGVTVSNIPYTTLNFNVFKLKKNINIIDTIGIPGKYQFSSILYKDIDLNSICFNKRIQPFTYKVKESYSVILGGLCYINLIYGNFALLTFYISNKVTIHMCSSEKVTSLLERKKCSFLYPPHIHNDFDLLKPFVKHTVKVYGKDFESIDDIVISDLCWFSITGRGIKIFEIFAPKNIKIYRRPSMINDAIKHTQIDVFKYKSFRGRTPKILRKKKKLLQELDRLHPTRRNDARNATIRGEQTQLLHLSERSDSSTISPLIADREDIEHIVHCL
ncbi:GTP-binding protein, putative [Plasmodium ovale]|uniref:GTP-binding protein, putative n=1 Tax=Plasmodium ovale TaxID=36330 RepID=A0A1D3TL91_PLAOA|nr:GTP-binding protein, putative [Plasmodium ovale]